MSAQQVQFSETIRAMKLALKRRPDDSDSDHSIHAPTNRGHKLQRRAAFVRRGHLDNTGGTQSYRHKVTHAGYTRHTISSNPTLVDADGDIVSGAEEQSISRDASPVEDDAFGEVQLERLLRPLTAASALPEHPSLSLGFKSTALTQMVEDAAEMVRRERASLWAAMRLLQRFRGDADWMPGEVFETEQDEMLLSTGGADMDGDEGFGVGGRGSTMPALGVDQTGLLEMKVAEDVDSMQLRKDTSADVMDGVQTADMAIQPARARDLDISEVAKLQQRTPDAIERVDINGLSTTNTKDSTHSITDSTDATTAATQESALTSIEPPAEAEAASEHSSNSAKDSNSTNPPQHAMTTRARARSPAHSPSPSPTPSDSGSIPPIHPWFLIPPSALPDRDLGLPPPEADESRQLLLLYVQKQEQIVRYVDNLYNGLQRAERIRWDVWRACKAEGHVKDDGRGNMVTEMSDGEDWYDPADWGLQNRDLKVGKDGRLGLEKGKDEIDDVGDEAEGRRGGRRRRVHRM